MSLSLRLLLWSLLSVAFFSGCKVATSSNMSFEDEPSILRDVRNIKTADVMTAAVKGSSLQITELDLGQQIYVYRITNHKDAFYILEGENEVFFAEFTLILDDNFNPVFKLENSRILDTVLYEVMEQKYLSIFGAFKVDEIAEIVRPTRRFGVACGAGGVMSDLLQEARAYYRNNQTEELLAWLMSPFQPVKQAAALLILEEMEEQGRIKLEEKYQVVIEMVKNKEVEVNYCSGCTDWRTRPVSELVNGIEATYAKQALTFKE